MSGKATTRKAAPHTMTSDPTAGEKVAVGRICQREVDVASPGETVQAAARRMQQRKVGSLVVVTEDRKPVGIVTDRDLVLRVLAPGLDAARTPVRDVMTRQPVTASEQTSVDSAVSVMRKGGFRRLPIVDLDGQLSGLVTVDDILGLLSRQLGEISGLIAKEGPRSLEAVEGST